MDSKVCNHIICQTFLGRAIDSKKKRLWETLTETEWRVKQWKLHGKRNLRRTGYESIAESTKWLTIHCRTRSNINVRQKILYWDWPEIYWDFSCIFDAPISSCTLLLQEKQSNLQLHCSAKALCRSWKYFRIILQILCSLTKNCFENSLKLQWWV